VKTQQPRAGPAPIFRQIVGNGNPHDANLQGVSRKNNKGATVPDLIAAVATLEQQVCLCMFQSCGLIYHCCQPGRRTGDLDAIVMLNDAASVTMPAAAPGGKELVFVAFTTLRALALFAAAPPTGVTKVFAADGTYMVSDL